VRALPKTAPVGKRRYVMQRPWVVSPDYRAAIEAISSARRAQGLSQREVARRLGKPASFVNKVEMMERRLDIVEFVVLARALDLDPHTLLDQVLPSVSEKPEF
jgi:ribosome-binding protein aMBF1 (putative translation factor)